MHFDVPLSADARQGTVFRKSLGSYYLRTEGQIITCSISSKLRKHLVYPTADPSSLRPVVVAVEDIKTVDPVAIGDRVAYIPAGNTSGMITEVLSRKNALTRRDPGKKVLEQVIVTNVDQVIPIFAAAQPAPKWNLLDRYLVTAAQAGIPAIICINKIDLHFSEEIEQEMAYYRKIGYQVLAVSAVSGSGILAFREALRDRFSVFLGKSGVGKTTLLNAVQPGLGLRVNAVSQATGKGKHTTTHLEMFPLAFGGSVADTPGMREFALQNEDHDLALFFPEMRPLVGQCRFGLSCRHDHEPGCAIHEGVRLGRISQRRYESYHKLCEG